MRFLFSTLIFTLTACSLLGQSFSSKIENAFKNFERDDDLAHAIVGLKIIDAETSQTIFSKNPEVGLAPASCQKIVTAASSYLMLGKDFNYKTSLGYTGQLDNGTLQGNLEIIATGDPTFGSWRYKADTEDAILKDFQSALRDAGITEVNGDILLKTGPFQGESIPDGWIWQDIGNYYGAGAQSFNWRENQFDLYLNSGDNEGDDVAIGSSKPPVIAGLKLQSQAHAGKPGSGDNAYIYFPLTDTTGFLRGTIPPGKTHFAVSGALPSPFLQFRQQFIAGNGVAIEGVPNTQSDPEITTIFTHESPILDSIVYWFLQKSVNLYGEALMKTMGQFGSDCGSTDSGVAVVKRLWKNNGIDPYALNIIDGSGLSPGNRVTASALVSILGLAKKSDWYNGFYRALPEINGIKMKSGTIGGVLSYAGYVHSKAGRDYIFAFIINNYDGSAGAMRRKMWRFLDNLK